jgi:arsenite methyltransferase
MQGTVQKLRVLFLCTGNSCRSQMAEGWARHLKGDLIEPYSAGIETHGLNPNAVKVMAEAGVDISAQRSKYVDEVRDIPFDYVVTVCDDAHELCPLFPGRTKIIHVGFDDPPRLARQAQNEQEVMNCYRKVRNKIRRFVESLPDSLKTQNILSLGESAMTENAESSESVRASVREGYTKIAKGCSGGCCGAANPAQLAQAIGYTQQDLEALPAGANLGLSCGNPTALAGLKPGQVVLDLGSGAGFDAFVAAPKVGPTGRVIGVDMTPEMAGKARSSVAAFTRKTGLDNVEFRLGEIEHLPVADNSVDVVISNCVINLSPQKDQVWREIARVLKPGGRVAVSDLALLKPLPEGVREMVEALIGCIAGAVLVDETHAMAESADLVDIVLTPKSGYVDGMTDWNDPLYRKIIERLPQGSKASDYVTSLEVTANKKDGQTSRTGKKLYTPAVGELVAIGAAIAANCEACFKYHSAQARKLGVSQEDMACAVTMAQKVKEAPARAVLDLANKLLGRTASAEEAGTPPAGTCCGPRGTPDCCT